MTDWIGYVTGPLGALISLALFLWGFRQGWWHTTAEVEAWKGRATRAEGQSDTVLPSLEKLTVMVANTARDQSDMAHQLTGLIAFNSGMKRSGGGMRLESDGS